MAWPLCAAGSRPWVGTEGAEASRSWAGTEAESIMATMRIGLGLLPVPWTVACVQLYDLT